MVGFNLIGNTCVFLYDFPHLPNICLFIYFFSSFSLFFFCFTLLCILLFILHRTWNCILIKGNKKQQENFNAKLFYMESRVYSLVNIYWLRSNVIVIVKSIVVVVVSCCVSPFNVNVCTFTYWMVNYWKTMCHDHNKNNTCWSKFKLWK